MTPPKIPSIRLIPDLTCDYCAPDPFQALPEPVPPTQLRLNNFRLQFGPGGNSVGLFPGIFGNIPLYTINRPKPPEATADWLTFFTQLAGSVQSLDLDFYNVPVNQGNNLRRFSEFAPKNLPPKKTNISIPNRTTARVHGEIRPIAGTHESLLTRFVVQYTPTLKHDSGLEISGFSAAEAPDIKYDRSFTKRQSVLSVKTGDLDYENPLHSGDPLVTPFDSEAKPPPSGHKDWMIVFNHVPDTLSSGIKASVGLGKWELDSFAAAKKGKGTLWLWAFLPTMGLLKPDGSYSKKMGVRYNTMPRNLGSLVTYFSPLFDKNQSGRLKHEGPFYNPNSEYMALYTEKGSYLTDLAKKTFGKNFQGDAKGACKKLSGTWKQDICNLPLPKKYDDVARINQERTTECKTLTQAGKADQCRRPIGRTAIPKDRHEVVKINDVRRLFDAAEIGANRGTIIDWVFLDLVRDNKRLSSTPDSKMPYATGHVKFRPGKLSLPFGTIELGKNTEVKFRYFLNKIEDPKTKTYYPQLSLQVDIQPLDLAGVDLQIGGFRIQSKKLSAKKISFVMPALPGIAPNAPEQGPKLALTMDGISSQDLLLVDPEGRFEVKTNQISLDRLTLSRVKDNYVFSTQNIHADELKVRTPMASFEVEKAKIPGSIQLIQANDPVGKPKRITLTVPAIEVLGNFSIGEKGMDSNYVKLAGSTTLQKIYFDRVWFKDESRVEARFKFSGSIPVAEIGSPSFGKATFTTVNETGGKKSEPLSGSFYSALTLNNDPKKDSPKPEYEFEMKLPFVGLETDGRLKIEKNGATLKNGTISLKPGNIRIAGDVDLKDGTLNGLGEGETQLGAVLLNQGSPLLKNMKFKGRIAFEKFPGGWRVLKPDASKDPLVLKFKISDSGLTHVPDLAGTFLAGRPASKVIKTQVKVKNALVELQELKKVEYQNPTQAGEKGRLTHLESGPLTIHHIEGEGSLWVNLLIWGFVRGFFPQLGGSAPSAKTKKIVPRPAVDPLIEHLPAEVKKQLKGGDFFRIGKIHYQVNPDGSWDNKVEDILLNLHEVNGRGQFGMIRIPEIHLGKKGNRPFFSLGKGDYWANIFLNEPDRGGSFRIVRWFKPPAK